MAIPNFQQYSELIYSLQVRHPTIQQSTLVLVTTGRTLAKLEGQVIFLKVSVVSSGRLSSRHLNFIQAAAGIKR